MGGGGGGEWEAGWGLRGLVHAVWSEAEDFKAFNTLEGLCYLEWHLYAII